MISNSQIQAAWIAKLKSSIAITALVSSAEIREDLWKGTDFVYPNIRVKMGLLTPQSGNRCEVFHSDVTIQVYGEQKSSKTTDDIAGTIATELWGKTFTSLGIKFSAVNLTSLVPADVPENDPNSWMSQVNFRCLVQAA